MEIGGVLVYAGMQLDIAENDYLFGSGRVSFIVGRVEEMRRQWDIDWVIFTGAETPPTAPAWRPRRLQVRVASLKRSLILGVARGTPRTSRVL